MAFSDIHAHMLCSCDDGAANEQIMCEMLDRAYEDGARYICLTPHFHPGYFGDNIGRSEESFSLLKKYAEEKYSDLSLALGNELRYEKGCVSWLADGMCRTMNGTKLVLVDFSQMETKYNITKGLNSLLNAGYIPILAHAERYDALHGDIKLLSELWQRGVIIQTDTRALFGDFGGRSRRMAKKLLKAKLVRFVSSDAHDLTHRAPGMLEAYRLIEKKYGREYADEVCFTNAYHLIFEKD